MTEEAALCCVFPRISFELNLVSLLSFTMTFWACTRDTYPVVPGKREHPTLKHEPSTFSANIFLWVWVKSLHSYIFGYG